MQQSGRVTVKVDGNQLRSKSGAGIKVGGTEREDDMTDQGDVFYKEKNVPAEVTCTLVHVADTDVDGLRSFKDGTVQYETDTGVVYTVANAFTKNLGQLKNGEIDVTFGGAPAK